MKKFILLTIFAFIMVSFFIPPPGSAFAFLGLGENSSELDCRKFWDNLSEGDQLAIVGVQQGGNKWQLSSGKNVLQKKDSDYCELKGQQFDTDSEGELKNGFELNISYFQNQEEARSKVGSLKTSESVKVDNTNISGDTYSMRTLNVKNEEGGWTTLLPGNYGRTVGRIGNCVVSLTQTWYALANQWNTGGEYDKQAGLMDIIMLGTKSGWQFLSESKDLQQFCEDKADGNQEKASQPQQSKPDQAGQPVKQSKSSQNNGSPFNIFGINPYQMWLNLNELAEARAFMGTGGLERFTETTILHGVGKVPSWEKDAREMDEANKFYNQASERFVKLKGKAEWTEINDTTKKTLIEATGDSVTVKKDSALIDLQSQGGQRGVLETGDKPTLKSGAVDVIVEPQDGKQFEMQTPNAEILVIGTEFSVIYDQKNNATIIAVYRGKVEVKTNDGKKTTISPDGDQPGVLVVSRKLSPVKLGIIGLVTMVILGGVFLVLKKKFASKVIVKKKR